jgi:hypothetical protein
VDGEMGQSVAIKAHKIAGAEMPTRIKITNSQERSACTFLYRRQARRERVTRVRRAEQVALRVGKHQAVSQIIGECSR